MSTPASGVIVHNTVIWVFVTPTIIPRDFGARIKCTSTPGLSLTPSTNEMILS